MKNKLTLSIICALIANIYTINAQTTYVVDNNPNSGAQFSDIQSAIDAASDGDTIYVQQSEIRYAAVTLDKELHVIGRGHEDELYNTNVLTFGINQAGSGSTLKGLRTEIRSVGSDVNNINISECKLSFLSIAFGASNITASDWIIEGNELSVVGTGLGVANIIFSNNFFNMTSPGPDIDNPSEVLLTQNIFLLNFNGNFVNRNSNNNAVLNVSNSIISTPSDELIIPGNFQLNNCLIYNRSNPAQNVGITSSATVQNTSGLILGQSPQFTIPIDTSIPQQIFNFTLQAGSPAINAGIGGENIGFQNNFVYKYLGTPKGFPTVKVTNYQSLGSQNGTITFDIEARSH
ncbi:MAG: hypothetical protein WBG46_08445 [Nonlabens sp.]